MIEEISDFYRGKRVLVTGHTGFKGSWLCEWLLMLGAEVVGLSLEPETEPALFRQLGLGQRLEDRRGDIRDSAAVSAVLQAAAPDLIFHMAAQPLVRLSYRQAFETFEINAMGTACLLEALRGWDRPCATVVITSDKCYENIGSLAGYTEESRLGGHDPYSASKACAELVASSYRRSFFSSGTPVAVATGRAGNVIGGGDWSQDRIVPDCIRSLRRNLPIVVRNRRAVRPWQHVLEPLRGYLALAAAIYPERTRIVPVSETLDAFNFGPDPESHRTVEELVEEVLRYWPGHWEDRSDPSAPHEASILTLNADKAARLLNWRPAWTFRQAVAETVQWYRAAEEAGPEVLAEFTRRQIRKHTQDAARQTLAAARSA